MRIEVAHNNNDNNTNNNGLKITKQVPVPPSMGGKRFLTTKINILSGNLK